MVTAELIPPPLGPIFFLWLHYSEIFSEFVGSWLHYFEPVFKRFPVVTAQNPKIFRLRRAER